MSVLQAPPLVKHEIAERMSDIIKTVDQHARQINRKWGFNRLPHVVPIEWTERFIAQKGKWEAACFECAGSLDTNDLDRVRRHGDAMLRAYTKLEEVAVEAGHFPSHAQTWEFELADGTPVVLVRDREELGQVDLGGRAAQVWSLDEIASIVSKFPELTRAKDAFPGAEVIQLRTSRTVIDKLNDELSNLPF